MGARSSEFVQEEAYEAYARRDFKRAVDKLSELIYQQPQSARWSEMRAQVLLDSKNFAAAIMDYNEAMNRTPGPALLHHAAAVYLQSSAPPECSIYQPCQVSTTASPTASTLTQGSGLWTRLGFSLAVDWRLKGRSHGSWPSTTTSKLSPLLQKPGMLAHTSRKPHRLMHTQSPSSESGSHAQPCHCTAMDRLANCTCQLVPCFPPTTSAISHTSLWWLAHLNPASATPTLFMRCMNNKRLHVILRNRSCVRALCSAHQP